MGYVSALCIYMMANNWKLEGLMEYHIYMALINSSLLHLHYCIIMKSKYLPYMNAECFPSFKLNTRSGCISEVPGGECVFAFFNTGDGGHIYYMETCGTLLFLMKAISLWPPAYPGQLNQEISNESYPY